MNPQWFTSVALSGVVLRVGDLSRVSNFYESVLGLRAAALDDGSLGLFSGSGETLVVLAGGRDAPGRTP